MSASRALRLLRRELRGPRRAAPARTRPSRTPAGGCSPGTTASAASGPTASCRGSTPTSAAEVAGEPGAARARRRRRGRRGAHRRPGRRHARARDRRGRLPLRGARPPLPLALALRLAPPRRPPARRPHARWRAVATDHERGVVRRPPGVALDSGGLAKGLFADLSPTRSPGAPASSSPAPATSDWAASAPGPSASPARSPARSCTRSRSRPGGVATSGISRRSWLDDRGRAAHHLLDPATGRPAFTGVVQATALRADRARGRAARQGRRAQRPGRRRRLAAGRRRRRARRRQPRRRRGLSRLSGSSHPPPTAAAEARRMTATALSPALLRYAPPGASPAPQIDVVVPVHDEQATLERSVRRLHRYLASEFPFSWRIVIADNASTDATPAIAARLARELPGVDVLSLERKGRGRALRAAWAPSRARVVCYMDVDLSTDLRGLLPLVAPLLSGHSRPRDRHPPGARRPRRARRQARAHLAHLQPPPARDAARPLLRRAVRLQGRARATCSTACSTTSATTAGSSTPSCSCSPSAAACASTRCRSTGSTTPTRASRSCAPRSTTSRASRGWPRRRGSRASCASAWPARSPTRCSSCCCGPRSAPGAANALALALTAVANTAANRRLTFGVRGRAGLLRQHALGALVYLLTLGLTTGALGVLHGLDAGPPRAVELAVLVAAGTVATVTRFVALRSWVFARRRRLPPRCSSASSPTTTSAAPAT